MEIENIIKSAEKCTFSAQTPNGPTVLIMDGSGQRIYENLTDSDFRFLVQVCNSNYTDYFYKYYRYKNIHVWISLAMYCQGGLKF